MATGLAGFDLLVSTGAAWALYKPYGTGGIVAGTGIGTSAAAIAQAVVLRRELGGLEITRLLATTVRIAIASLALAGASYGIWSLLDGALGEGLLGQIVALGAGLGAGALVYLAAARLLRIAELEQIMRLLRRR
jgi:putative peptidoglycan lipid II flippase